MSRRIPLLAIVGALAAGAHLAVVGAQPTIPRFSISDTAVVETGDETRTFVAFYVNLSSPSTSETRVRFTTSDGTAKVLLEGSATLVDAAIPGLGTGSSSGAPASVYPISFTVTGADPSVRNVTVRLDNFTHSFPADVDVLVVGPTGQSALVLSDIGLGADAVNLRLFFSDLASAIAGPSLTSGTFLPSVDGTTDPFPAPAPAGPYGTSLSVFDRLDPNGTWKFFIVDDAPSDTGSMGNVGVTFETRGSDYFSHAVELVFPPGRTRALVNVETLGDSTLEPHEQFFGRLSNPVNAFIADGEGIAYLLNDDGGGVAPTAVADNFQMPIDGVLSVGAPGLLANDTTNIGGPITFVLTAVQQNAPDSGWVVLNADGSFVYTPRPGFGGTESFLYRAITPSGYSALATVTIKVGSEPTSVGDAFTTPFNTPLGVPAPGVLGNDNAHNSGPMFANLASLPAHGVVTLNGNGSFVYAPASGFHGADSFTYRAENFLGEGPVTTVTLTVGPPPTAVADSFTTAFQTPLSVPAPGVLGNDNGNGGGPLTAVLLTSTMHGTLSMQSDGGFTYTPQTGFAGADSFTYRVHAAGPGGTATVTLSVNEPTTVQPPTDLYVSSLVGNTVTFRFDAPALGPDATGFVLEGGLNPGEVLASLATGTDAPIFTIVAPTGSFFVRFHALNGAEKSGPSNEIRIHVNVPVPPSAPDRFSSTVNGNALLLSWRNTFGGGPPAGLVLDLSGSANAQLPLGNTESLAVNGVPGGTYTLSVRAVNGGGGSPASAPITVTIPSPCAGPPATPAAFLGYRVGNTVFVVWEPATSGPAAESYVLNVTGSFVGSLPIAACGLSGQVGPGAYTLTVAALNACGVSAATVAQTVVVP